jgi:hypothetical protein
MTNVSTSIKLVVSLVVVAALVATRFSSSSINVSDEWIDRRKEAAMTLLPSSDDYVRFAFLCFSLFIYLLNDLLANLSYSTCNLLFCALLCRLLPRAIRRLAATSRDPESCSFCSTGLPLLTVESFLERLPAVVPSLARDASQRLGPEMVHLLDLEISPPPVVDPVSSTPITARLWEALLEAALARRSDPLQPWDLEPSSLLALLFLLVLDPLDLASAPCSSTL